MPLHEREPCGRSSTTRCSRGATSSPRCPSTASPGSETNPDAVFQVVSDELLLDGNARQNLATFCQTWEEPQVHALMDLAIDKNMIDKDEYPQTAEIERRCVHMLADLWNAPDAANTVGASAIGSSEACMLGGMAAKWRWRAARAAARASPPTSRTWCAARCRSCGTSSRSTGTSRCARSRCAHGTYTMTPEDMLERVDENTIFVVPTLGLTYTGVVRAGAGDRPTRSTSCRRTPASTSTSTSTRRAAASPPRSARPTWCGTSGCRG